MQNLFCVKGARTTHVLLLMFSSYFAPVGKNIVSIRQETTSAVLGVKSIGSSIVAMSVSLILALFTGRCQILRYQVSIPLFKIEIRKWSVISSACI